MMFYGGYYFIIRLHITSYYSLFLHLYFALRIWSSKAVKLVVHKMEISTIPSKLYLSDARIPAPFK